MSYKIIVLGAGLVGRAIAIDLHRSKDFKITSSDINPIALSDLQEQGINTIEVDFSRKGNIQKIIRDYDLVVGAVPGFMGFQMVKEVLEAGKDIVDISFFPEDPFELDNLALQNGVTAVVDCGIAPGMGNILLGYHNQRMKVESYECYVGGLPVEREWPYEYKAVFSPIDVIEEYTRPARYIQNGSEVVKEALSDAELIHFPEIGTLEAWNSDGLRSLIRTMDIPNMIEKTLRYPGCVEYLKVLRESGFFSNEPVEINDIQVRPIDLTAKLLFPKWKLKPGEEEFTIMRVRIKGLEDGNNKEYEYNVLDRFDKPTMTTSMARTTGYTATAAVHLIANKKFTRKGICPPEYLGESTDNFEFIMKYQMDRGINYILKG